MTPASTHQVLPARSHARTRRPLQALVLALLALASFAVPAQAGQSIYIEQTVVYASSESTAITLPSGNPATFVLKYRCDSTGPACADGEYTVTLPADLTITTVGTSAHVQSTTGTGQTRTFHMSPLQPGTTGAIAVDFNTPGVTTVDGTSWNWTASMTGSNFAAETTNSVSVTARAGSEPAVTGQRLSGGALGFETRYLVSACNVRKQPFATYGSLGVQAGSTVAVDLPAGAVIVDDAGGTLSQSGGVSTLTWTLGALGPACSDREIVLSYPESDPANTIGAVKTLPMRWEGRFVGESSTSTLDTGSVSHSLSPPSGDLTPFKDITAPRADGSIGLATIGDAFTWRLGGSNTGNIPMDTFQIDDPIPDNVVATLIEGHNYGRGPAELWVGTRKGPDGFTGTPDDGQLVKVKDIAAQSNFSQAVGGLTAADDAVAVRLIVNDLRATEGGTFLTIHATVLAASRSGVDATEGLLIRNDADFDWTWTQDGAPQSDSDSKFARLRIDFPTAGLYTRHYGATVPSGSRVTPWMELVASPVVDADLVNPVFVLQLPAGLTLEEWEGPANLPTPTVQTVENWNSTDNTLVRFTFPSGTVALNNTSYTLRYKVRLARNIYSTRTVRGYIHSRSQSVTCYQNFFDGSADSGDRDGDGNTTEILCPWFADIVHPTSSAAYLRASVRGSWDTDFREAPAIAATNPGSNDTLRLTLESQATMTLDNVSVIDVLSRAGDVGVISGAQRNATSSTFPIVLRGRPQVPTLDEPITTYYSTAVNPCRSDYGFSPSGCAAPAWTDWDVTAPSDIADVTAVKFDFGDNVMSPGDEWVTDLPVTTPATGATEPDRADVNPDPLAPNADEIAYNTAAFELRRTDINSTLLPAEGVAVGLRIPSAYGPPSQTISAPNLTSTGVGTAAQDVTVAVPDGGSIRLLDGSTPVTQLVVANVGTYTVESGGLRFVPQLGYHGTPPAVSYRRTNFFGTSATATYTPTVSLPSGPSAAAKTSIGPAVTPQTTSLTIPSGGSVRLLDGSTPVTQLQVPGQGTYVLDTSTGTVTFTPVRGYSGQATAVPYRVTDAYGQTASSTYTPTVTPPAGPAASPRSTEGVGPATHRTTLPLPEGGRVRLLEGGSEVTTLTVPGKGKLTLDPQTGELTFEPELGFTGEVPVPFRVTDEYGTPVDSVYTAKVLPPPPPATVPQRSTGTPGTSQSRTIEIPAGGRLELVGPDGSAVSEVVVPGQGRYVVRGASVVFEPLAGFSGTPTPARFRVVDAYGQAVEDAYSPVVEGSCASRRTMTINWRVPAGTRVRRYEVKVDGRTVARLSSKARRVTVDLKGKPRSTVRVQVVGKTARGARLGTTRVYRPCRTRLSGAPLETLRLRPMAR